MLLMKDTSVLTYSRQHSGVFWKIHQSNASCLLEGGQQAFPWHFHFSQALPFQKIIDINGVGAECL